MIGKVLFKSILWPCVLTLIFSDCAGAPAPTGKLPDKSANTGSFSPTIPTTWDDVAMASLELPLAYPKASPQHVSSQYYYSIRVRPIYRSYPVYAPGREPVGYWESLQRLNPEILWDDKGRKPALKTEQDWIEAGRVVFNAPISYDLGGITLPEDVRDPTWYNHTKAPVTSQGVLPFYVYVVREKGKVELGSLSCAMCHTRVLPDRPPILGAQGNFPFDRARTFNHRKKRFSEEQVQQFEYRFYGMPWLVADPHQKLRTMPLNDIIALHEAIPPGVLGRTRTSPFSPAKIPDLIGVKSRMFLDATGLQHHRSPADLMRYAALNQGGDDLASFNGFIPFGTEYRSLPEPDSPDLDGRYSDEQLYALALFLYSLEPPINPNLPTTPDQKSLVGRGERLFREEGCARCHNPEHGYTNNKLVPAPGFAVPAGHPAQQDIMTRVVGTDPSLTLTSRRGTGFYKVPSLLGVWYRGPFEHNGSCASLEDWFDPRRVLDSYVPTGWKGPPGTTTRPVKGHDFGLDLIDEDRKALIAFLRTL